MILVKADRSAWPLYLCRHLFTFTETLGTINNIALERRSQRKQPIKTLIQKSKTKMRLFLSILLLHILLDLQSVAGQGKAVSSAKDGETCPFLDGIFVSVMRRIFS